MNGDWGLMDPVKEGMWYFTTYLHYENSLGLGKVINMVSNNRKALEMEFLGAKEMIRLKRVLLNTTILF